MWMHLKGVMCAPQLKYNSCRGETDGFLDSSKLNMKEIKKLLLATMCLVAARLPTAEAIQESVNKRFDSLFHMDGSGRRSPFVCVVCDEFITKHPQKYQLSLKTLASVKDKFRWSNFPDSRRTPEIERH